MTMLPDQHGGGVDSSSLKAKGGQCASGGCKQERAGRRAAASFIPVKNKASSTLASPCTPQRCVAAGDRAVLAEVDWDLVRTGDVRVDFRLDF